MDKDDVIKKYRKFVKRQKDANFPNVYTMAFAYLEALCENGLLSYSEESELLQEAETWVK